MHVELAEDHRAGLLQSPHDLGIFGWDAIAILIAGGGGAHARGVEQIFEPDAECRAAGRDSFRRDFGFGVASLLQREIGGDGDEGVENGIESLDARQAFAREFERRQAASANLFGGFGEREHGAEW